MPNFAYTNNTQFRPFSFEEQLRPLQMYTKEHRAVEEAMGELDAQANAVGVLADETNDPKTYARYKAYESALRTQADALAKNGLTPSSRKTLLDLNARYKRDIIPIENAIKRRNALADEQRKAWLQNPTLMFQRDLTTLGYDSSLDRFLENPEYDYGSQYSGALLTKQVSDAASNLARELRSTKVSPIDSNIKAFVQQTGYTSGQILDAINNPNKAESQPVLNAIVEQVIGSSNILNWADKTTKKLAYDYANQGLWSAIGQSKYTMLPVVRPVSSGSEGTTKKGEEEPEEDYSKYYRTNSSAKTDGSKNTSQMEKDAQVLRELANNPKLIDAYQEKKSMDPYYISTFPTAPNLNTNSRPRTYKSYPYREAIANMGKRYKDLKVHITDGVLSDDSNLEEIANRLDQEIAESVIESQTYIPNLADFSLVSKVIGQNSRIHHRKTGHTGIYELDGDRKGGEIDYSDLKNYLNENTVIDYDPAVGFTIVSSDGNNEKNAVIDIELIDDPNNSLATNHWNIQNAINNKEYAASVDMIGAMMKVFYERFNTLLKRQGTTGENKD